MIKSEEGVSKTENGRRKMQKDRSYVLEDSSRPEKETNSDSRRDLHLTLVVPSLYVLHCCLNQTYNAFFPMFKFLALSRDNLGQFTSRKNPDNQGFHTF